MQTDPTRTDGAVLPFEPGPGGSARRKRAVEAITSATALPPLLEIEDLGVEFETRRGRLRAVDGVTWRVGRGQTVALVGESGSGKSATALSVLRLLDRNARIASGAIRFEGCDLLALAERDMCALRGREISMVFQEPMTSLNPIMSIGTQLAEPLRLHFGASREEARQKSLALLEQVGIADGARRLAQHPHQLSGGMRQRVMIAMALACDPKLIIADEPTTALDVTTQAQILELMRDLTRSRDIALVIITHNLGIVARYADVVNVMYAGRIVESGSAERIFHAPRHPYTRALLESVPRLDRPRRAKLARIDGLPPNLAHRVAGCAFGERCTWRQEVCETVPQLASVGQNHHVACHRALELGAPAGERDAEATCRTELPASPGMPILSVQALSMEFSVGAGKRVRAVRDVSFDVPEGNTIGLVGESGCGKTTVGRCILGLETPTAGQILYRGEELTGLGRGRRPSRRSIQAVFQDPFSSLNPRMTVGDAIAEPLLLHRLVAGAAKRRERVAELLEQVGMHADMAERYPHQLSGGQRQRVGIARALALEPEFIVCDEPVSALDVSIQGQVVNLLQELQTRLGLSYLFIAHDLAVVRHLSDRVIVMYLGRIVEMADQDAIFSDPKHPYTRALLAAVPTPDPEIERLRGSQPIRGELPSPLDPPPGCAFHTRCPAADAQCRAATPPLREFVPGRHVACWKAE